MAQGMHATPSPHIPHPPPLHSPPPKGVGWGAGALEPQPAAPARIPTSFFHGRASTDTGKKSMSSAHG
jgi:hypothetical protein